MRPITKEWVEKAEGDFATMEREGRVRTSPNYDAVCFHAQQCAEKYLKARLAEDKMKSAKIHDLVALLETVLPIEPVWESFRKTLAYLSEYAVKARYPGESATEAGAADAKKHCRSFRKAARTSLNLKTGK